MGILGKTEELLKLEPLREKFDSFGLDVTVIDGHNFDELAKAFSTKGERPRVRMSTVHRAKGDEADNVLLINPPSKRTRKMHHGTRDDLIRLLYVGMTRARETLYVTSGGELI